MRYKHTRGNDSGVFVRPRRSSLVHRMNAHQLRDKYGALLWRAVPWPIMCSLSLLILRLPGSIHRRLTISAYLRQSPTPMLKVMRERPACIASGTTMIRLWRPPVARGQSTWQGYRQAEDLASAKTRSPLLSPELYSKAACLAY